MPQGPEKNHRKRKLIVGAAGALAVAGLAASALHGEKPDVSPEKPAGTEQKARKDAGVDQLRDGLGRAIKFVVQDGGQDKPADKVDSGPSHDEIKISLFRDLVNEFKRGLSYVDWNFITPDTDIRDLYELRYDPSQISLVSPVNVIYGFTFNVEDGTCNVSVSTGEEWAYLKKIEHVEIFRVVPLIKAADREAEIYGDRYWDIVGDENLERKSKHEREKEALDEFKRRMDELLKGFRG